MEIRRAEVRDIPGMIALLHQVGDIHHNIRPDIFRTGCLKYIEKDLEALLNQEENPIFVAVKGGFVAGYCFCQHREYRDSSALTDRKEVYIDDLCVDESCRGQGIAKKLYDHVLDYSRGCGCAFVTLNVWTGNSAEEFYRKMGMTPRSITMETKLC